MAKMSGSFFEKYSRKSSYKKLKTFYENPIVNLTLYRYLSAAKNELIYKFSDNKRYPQACKILDECFEDVFQYAGEHSRLKSTGSIKRFNKKILSRLKVVRIFLSTESAI